MGVNLKFNNLLNLLNLFNKKPFIKFSDRKLNNKEQGMAVLETIPVLFMLALVFNFSLGFFGGVHSGILNSIASYNYAIETFRFKSNLMYFRPGGGKTHYAKSLNRVHGTTQDGSAAQSSGKEDKNKWPATQRGITFNYSRDNATRNLSSLQYGKQKQSLSDNIGDHEYAGRTNSTNIWKLTSQTDPQDGDTIQTPRIWIKTVYGMCLNSVCQK